MITVRDRRGEEHRGRSIGSVARRVYGRRAIVRYSPDPNNPFPLMVVTPARYQPQAYDVHAEWRLV